MKLIRYPEYPARIGRNNDYSVRVTVGNESAALPVYNELRQCFCNNVRSPWGDEYRRFCEFAFEGTAKIEITVRQSFSSCTVIPAAAGLPFDIDVKEDCAVVTVMIDRPQNFMLRLDNDVNSLLTVFAEAPETDVPSKDDPNVVWIEGWYENGENTLRLTAGQTLYIAPGSVCNARVLASGDDLTICGRGMVRDPYDVRSFNVHRVNYNVNITDSTNVTVRGIRIVDCRFYHLYCLNCRNVLIENVKLLSNQLSTDGYKLDDSDGVTLRDCYAHVGDDVFTLKSNNVTYENILCGSSCGIFSFTGKKENVKFRNISVFKADEAIFKHFYTSLENTPYGGVDIEGLYAVDCVFIPTLFSSRKQGKLPKDVVLHDVTMISPAGFQHKAAKLSSRTHAAIVIDDGSELSFDIADLYIDGKLCRTKEDIGVVDHSDDGAVFRITADPSKKLPLFSNTKTLPAPFEAPVLPVEAPAKGTNLIRNGGFEEGIGAFTTQTFSDLALIGDAYAGKYALRLGNSKGKAECGTSLDVTKLVRMNGAGKYRVSFYVKRGEGGEGNEAQLRQLYQYGKPTWDESMKLVRNNTTIVLTPDWKKVEIELTFETADVNSAYLLWLNNGVANTMDFCLDEIEMVKLD